MPKQAHNFDEINKAIKTLWLENDKKKSAYLAIELANKILEVLGVPSEVLKEPDLVLDEALSSSKFSNQKMETWFASHFRYSGARLALNHFDHPEYLLKSRFYQLNKSATKARISASTQIDDNWEDSELTRKPEYKVGIDFFLKPNADSLLMVVSNYGNLRVLELTEKITHTQKDIFNNLIGILQKYDGIDPKTGERIEFEPQKSIHKSLWEALSLESVNKVFYKEIADLFNDLQQFIIKNPPSKKIKNLTETSKIFSIRLLGRILFTWFLRKKGFINTDKNYFEIGDSESADYYERKLKPLFFDTFNRPIEDRSSNDKTTPYLNGGLFSVHDDDLINYKVQFPKAWFNRLYEHLDRYNFTIDESSPEYEQVAIDPEMLGRVFENLLATIIPETSIIASEKKNKGAFYTPREIVSYMTKEALKEYLINELDNDKDNHGVELLIEMNDAAFIERKSTGGADLWGSRTDTVSVQLIDILDRIRIFDPAVGSGAFPIGMMHLISKTYQRLQAVYNKSLRKHYIGKSTERFNSYETKLHIIQSCLFAADIEPMAIEISKLRAWLSLIIEADSKIEPLPNLDFNFVCCNSLVPLEENTQLSIYDDVDYEERFANFRRKFFSTHTLSEKENLKSLFNEIYSEKLSGNESSLKIKQLRSWNPFTTISPSMFFDPKIMFNVEDFDIVIGNPPYKKSEYIDQDELNTLNKIYGYNSDYYIYFSHRAFDFTRKGGILAFITNDGFVGLKNSEKLRYNLLINDLKRITSCPAETFNASIYTAIFIVLKTEDSYYHSINLDRISNDSYLTSAFEKTNTVFQLRRLGKVNKELSMKMPNLRLVYWNERINYYKKVLELPTLSDYVKILDTGIDSGNVRSKLFFKEQPPNKDYKKLIQGKQIDRYIIDWDSPKSNYKYVNIDYKPSDDFGLGRAGKTSNKKEYWNWRGSIENHQLSIRIVLRQSDDDLVAALIEKNYDGQLYTDNTLFTIRPINNTNLYLVLGIINSKPMNDIYQFLSNESGKSQAQVKLSIVNRLPFPKLSLETELKIINIVKEIISDYRIDLKTNVDDKLEKIDELVQNGFILTN